MEEKSPRPAVVASLHCEVREKSGRDYADIASMCQSDCERDLIAKPSLLAGEGITVEMFRHARRGSYPENIPLTILAGSQFLAEFRSRAREEISL